MSSEFQFTKKFRLPNPENVDEKLIQEVSYSNRPQYDYTNAKWLAVDTEFINLDITRDKLCAIQIASLDKHGKLQLEVIWVWEANFSDEQLKIHKEFWRELLNKEDLELIMHVSSADLSRIEKLADFEFKGKVFDTKTAGKIALTNTDNHSMDFLINYLVDPHFSKNKSAQVEEWDHHPNEWSDAMYEYAALDVYYLHTLKERLLEVADRRGLTGLVNKAMTALPAISSLMRHGYDESVLVY
jgi:ribonuclease D